VVTASGLACRGRRTENRALLPAGVEVRVGDVTDLESLRRVGLGDCRTIFFAVDITGGVGGRRSA